MKNYTLVLTIALFVSACSSSKQFHQAPSVSFKLPKGAKQLAFEEFYKTYDKKKSELRHGYVNLYQIDSFYIGTKPIIEREFSLGELNHIKESMQRMRFLGENSIGLKNYESTVKTYNNTEVLTEYLETDWYQVSYFSFNIINQARTQMLVGVLQFPKTGKARATVLLDKFLTSIRFEPADTSKNGL